MANGDNNQASSSSHTDASEPDVSGERIQRAVQRMTQSSSSSANREQTEITTFIPHALIGDWDITHVQFDDIAFGNFLSAFIADGSRLRSLSWSDLKVRHESINGDNRPDVTLSSLVTSGTALFDALLYIKGTTAERQLIQLDDRLTLTNIPTLVDVKRNLFMVYFVLMIRGSMPRQGEPIPNFLRLTRSNISSFDPIVGSIASFNLNAMGHSWIKHVDISQMGIEALNRFAMGVAGYRNIAAICSFTPNKVDMPNKRLVDGAVRARGLLKAWYDKGYVWDAHSVTRSNRFMTKFPNFNNQLIGMMFWLFNTEKIMVMKATKAVFDGAVIVDGNQAWMEWADDIFNEFNDYIFPADMLQALRQLQ